MKRDESTFANPAAQEAARRLGELLRQARIARRWTILELAERARVSPATLKRIEKGSLSASMGAWLSVFELVGLLPRLKALDDPTSSALLESTRARRVRARRSASDLDF